MESENVAEPLAQLKSLRSLNLSYNALGYGHGAGAKALSKSLAQLKSLRSLDLSGNLLNSTEIRPMFPDRIKIRI